MKSVILDEAHHNLDQNAKILMQQLKLEEAEQKRLQEKADNDEKIRRINLAMEESQRKVEETESRLEEQESMRKMLEQKMEQDKIEWDRKQKEKEAEVERKIADISQRANADARNMLEQGRQDMRREMKEADDKREKEFKERSASLAADHEKKLKEYQEAAQSARQKSESSSRGADIYYNPYNGEYILSNGTVIGKGAPARSRGGYGSHAFI